MRIRLFPDGQTYVHDQEIEIDDDTVLLPLTIEDTDISTITTDSSLLISDTPVSVIMKGDQEYVGTLKSYTDHYAIITSRGIDQIIRNYDRIENPHLISAVPVGNDIGQEILISYLTSAINGQVIHHLYTDSQGMGHLQSLLLIDNEGLTDLVDTEIEVITASQQDRPVMRAMAFETTSNAVPASSGIGTIYRLSGTYDIPADYQATVSIIDEDIPVETIYSLDAPNGRNNATYTLSWVSPVDLPPGRLLVYQDGMMQGTTSISSTGEGQEVTTSLLKVPSIYAQGNIQVNTQRSNGAIERQRVSLTGTIYNTLSTDATVYLRYYVGDATVPNIRKEDGYLIFPYEISANGSRMYSHTFTVDM